MPNSCTGEVTRFDPTTGALTTEHKFPSSVLLGGAQVSPDGQWLLATVGVCTSYQNQHLLAINLVTGAEWTVGASATACHSLGAVSWNETGSELVVPFGPSNLPPGSTHGQRMIGGESCLVHKPVGLAVVNTGSSSEFSEHALIEPASGCEYESAIFDSEGILAVEGCTEGAPHRQHFQPEPREGQAYLLQLSESGEIVRRLPLAVGSEPGLVASDPETGTILVSDDVGREGSECDWIWEYANGTLRLIKRYSEDLFVKPW